MLKGLWGGSPWDGTRPCPGWLSVNAQTGVSAAMSLGQAWHCHPPGHEALESSAARLAWGLFVGSHRVNHQPR